MFSKLCGWGFEYAARLSRKKTIVVSTALLAICCQGLKDRCAIPPTTPPFHFSPTMFFLSRTCAHCWGGMKYGNLPGDARLSLPKCGHDLATTEKHFPDLCFGITHAALSFIVSNDGS
jgi:hypothetical protein